MKTGRKTKIIATIGPATMSPDMLAQLIDAGLNVARLNMSHGTPEFVFETVRNIREISQRLDQRVAIMMDLQGPAIRTGTLPVDLELEPGELIALTVKGAVSEELQSVDVNYDGLVDDIAVGDTVLVDNGNIHLKVIDKEENHLKCEVLTEGTLGSRRHINLPGVRVNLPGLTEKDRRDVATGLEAGVDLFSMSFVREAKDVVELKQIIASNDSHQRVIAKLEDQQGLKNIDAIIAAADGLMVARGDLGIEVPFEELPIIQRRVVKACLEVGKPVIVATHMLESMVENPSPTRAEITDVANAVYSQADAIMLSGETSVGGYPLKCFDVMDRIARRIESDPDNGFGHHPPMGTHRAKLVRAACSLADDLGPETPLVVFTRTGRMALNAAWFRPVRSSIFAFTDNPKLLHQLALLWGVEPLLMTFEDDPSANGPTATALLKEKGLVTPGDELVVVSDLLIRGERFETVHTVTVK